MYFRISTVLMTASLLAAPVVVAQDATTQLAARGTDFVAAPSIGPEMLAAWSSIKAKHASKASKTSTAVARKRAKRPHLGQEHRFVELVEAYEHLLHKGYATPTAAIPRTAASVTEATSTASSFVNIDTDPAIEEDSSSTEESQADETDTDTIDNDSSDVVMANDTEDFVDQPTKRWYKGYSSRFEATGNDHGKAKRASNKKGKSTKGSTGNALDHADPYSNGIPGDGSWGKRESSAKWRLDTTSEELAVEDKTDMVSLSEPETSLTKRTYSGLMSILHCNSTSLPTALAGACSSMRKLVGGTTPKAMKRSVDIDAEISLDRRTLDVNAIMSKLHCNGTALPTALLGACSSLRKLQTPKRSVDNDVETSLTKRFDTKEAEGLMSSLHCDDRGLPPWTMALCSKIRYDLKKHSKDPKRSVEIEELPEELNCNSRSRYALC
jgi:hypothetical protein